MEAPESELSLHPLLEEARRLASRIVVIVELLEAQLGMKEDTRDDR